MKAVAARPEDIPDIQALAAQLGLVNSRDVLSVVTRYVPQTHIAPRT